MEDLKDTVKKFRAILVLNGLSLKEFCSDNDFDYTMFSQAIGGIRPFRDEYKQAVHNYTLNSEGRSTLKKIRG
jgi:hypothetical protein